MTWQPESTTLLPATYDLLWTLAVVCALPLLVVALLRWRTTALRRPLLWLLVMLLLPVLGPVVFLLSAPRAPRES